MIIAVGIFNIVSVGQLLWCTKHDIISDTVVFNNIEELLLCASQTMPEFKREWTLLHNCATISHVYPVAKSWVPFQARSSTAFVIKFMDKNGIFTNEKNYKSLPPIVKALILIHECTHLSLHTVDYAYLDQPIFAELTQKQHLNNADSFVKKIMDNCTNTIII